MLCCFAVQVVSVHCCCFFTTVYKSTPRALPSRPDLAPQGHSAHPRSYCANMLSDINTFLPWSRVHPSGMQLEDCVVLCSVWPSPSPGRRRISALRSPLTTRVQRLFLFSSHRRALCPGSLPLHDSRTPCVSKIPVSRVGSLDHTLFHQLAL